MVKCQTCKCKIVGTIAYAEGKPICQMCALQPKRLRCCVGDYIQRMEVLRKKV